MPPTSIVCVADVDVELPVVDDPVSFAMTLERPVGREYRVPVLVKVMVFPLLA